jgi:phosphoesterase RecJ-like protein
MLEKNLYTGFIDKLKEYKRVTILTHINPDADTLGTGLGIYSLLKVNTDLKIEIVNKSLLLPKYLDFLPNFHKIKSKMDYMDSLIIACDAGSLDRLGVDLEGRDIVNIDHHSTNRHYGSINIVDKNGASASLVAYNFFKEFYPINKDSANCFYTALFSDTLGFTTNNVDDKVFKVAYELVKLGAKPQEVGYNFTQRKSLSFIRILQQALSTLTLAQNAKIASIYITQEDMLKTNIDISQTDSLIDYPRSLVTVEIAIFLIELEDKIKVSLRSKSVDISSVALSFGGGGHKNASGFSVDKRDIQEIIDTIIAQIIKLGLINEK